MELKKCFTQKSCIMKSKQMDLFPSRKRVKVMDLQKEIPRGESQTVPDDALSVKDFLKRYTLGTAPAIGVNPIFLDGEHDDEDMDAFARMDFAERDEVITMVMTEAAAKKVEMEMAERKAKAAKALIAKAAEDERLKEMISKSKLSTINKDDVNEK